MILRAFALAIMVGTLAVTGSAVREPPRDPGTLARTILSDTSRYHLARVQMAKRPKNWLERAWDWIALQWSRLLRALFSKVRVPARASTAIGDAVEFVFIALLVLAFAKIFRVLRWRANARAPLAPGSEIPDARALYDRSLAAAADGVLTHAIELLFAAAVATLDRRGLTRYAPSSTVGDFRRDLRARDASLVGTFDAIAAPFTAAVYAERPPNEADWARARAAFLLLQTERDAA